MEARQYAKRTVGSACNAILALLRWCSRNAPNVVAVGAGLVRLPHAALGKATGTPVNDALDSSRIKEVLKACYSEIEEVESRLWAAKSLPLSSSESADADVILRLLSLGNGMMPGLKQVAGFSGVMTVKSWLAAKGGLRKVASTFYLGIDDVFPFYLAILTQASGNPRPVLDASRDCIQGVPLRPDLERFVFFKRRAHREQDPEFPKKNRWAATNIVRRLLILNEDLVEHAPERHRQSLFLCRGGQGEIAPPSWQAIHDRFHKFRAKYSLPDFELRDLRGAGGRLHHQAGRGIAAAKSRLKHADVSTTLTYTPLEDRRQHHEAVIQRFQGLMFNAALAPSKDLAGGLGQATLPRGETLFGFGCKDPFEGTVPGTRKGELCRHFSQCASCPSAMVVVDDHRVVARIEAARSHLLRERARAISQGWIKRFELIYGPTLIVIERDVLPAIAPSTLEAARRVRPANLPSLE